MSKNETNRITAPGAPASRPGSTQKVLDIYRRFIDDPIQARNRTFEAKPTHAEFELLRLLALAGTAEAFNNDRSDTSPYREWIKAHSEEVIPNDFAGGYNVRSELFWNLETKYHTLRIAERIAWAAVENPQPHDCEGDEVCHYLPLEPLLNICEGTRMARMLLKPSRSLTSCLRMTSSNSQTGKKPTR